MNMNAIQVKIHGGIAQKNWMADNGDTCGHCNKELIADTLSWGHYITPLFCSYDCLLKYAIENNLETSTTIPFES